MSQCFGSVQHQHHINHLPCPALIHRLRNNLSPNNRPCLLGDYKWSLMVVMGRHWNYMGFIRDSLPAGYPSTLIQVIGLILSTHLPAWYTPFSTGDTSHVVRNGFWTWASRLAVSYVIWECWNVQPVMWSFSTNSSELFWVVCQSMVFSGHSVQCNVVYV